MRDIRFVWQKDTDLPRELFTLDSMVDDRVVIDLPYLDVPSSFPITGASRRRCAPPSRARCSLSSATRPTSSTALQQASP